MHLSSTVLLAATATLTLLVPQIFGAPVPIPEEDVEEEEGLLLLVPTVPMNEKGQPTKREVDYELISIPADIIKRTVREVSQSYGVASSLGSSEDIGATTGSILVSDLNSDDDDEFIISADVNLVASPSDTKSQKTDIYTYGDDDDFLNNFGDDFSIGGGTTSGSFNTGGVSTSGSYSTVGGSTSGSYGTGGIKSTLPVLTSADLSKILSSVTSAGLTGATLAGQAKEALSTATRVGTSAVVGGTQAVKWVLQKKATGLRNFAEFAGAGLQYAGRLSSAVLRVLLRVPGIKARVISDLIKAGQPLATAVSDVITESADDIQDILAAQSDIFKDAINILFRLVSDVLAVKGRLLASFGAGGLDKGTNLISSGVKVGSAFVQTAGDVFSAVSRGVGELVKVASEANLPKPPPLPQIRFPQLPTITYVAPKPSYSSPAKETYSSKGTHVTTGYAK